MPDDRPLPASDPQPSDQGRRELLRWAWRLPVLLAVAGTGVGGYLAWRVHFGKVRPAANPEFEAAQPLRVADFEALATVWSAVTFHYRGLPAVALRLPEAVPGGLSIAEAHYAAFSRVCTHQSCVVEWNTNPEAIAVAANYRSDRPALVCGCHLSVFDPGRAGLVVSGPAVVPLPRLALEARADGLYAVGVERSETA